MAQESMLHEDLHYVALAKNMRAIIYISDDLTPQMLEFVAKYHRYRMVGYDSEIKPPRSIKKVLKRKCFIPLNIPPRYNINAVDKCQRIIAIAALHLAPIIADSHSIGEFEPYTIHRIYGSKPWDIREFLRHLRISEYAMIDFALNTVDNGRGLNAMAREDINKRFWRILGSEENCILGDIIVMDTQRTYMGPVIVLYINYEDFIS